MYEPRPHTRVQPAAFAEEGKWLAWNKWAETFPNEGTVFTANHPHMSVDTLFAFDAMEATDQSQKDQFRLRDWRRVEEVLDFSDRDPEETRRLFVELGIPGRRGVKETVVVALPDQTCVRISLVPDPNRDRSVAELTDLEKLKLYDFDRSLFDGIKVDGRWLTVPDITIGAETGVVDWSLDKDFLDGVIKQLKRLAMSDNGTLPFPQTKVQVQSLLTALDRYNLLPAHQGEWRNANTRLWHLVDDLRLGFGVINEIVGVLSTLDPIEEKLSAEFASRRAVIEDELTTRLETEISQRIEAEFASLSEINGELARGNAELSEATETLRAELGTIAARHERVSAELKMQADSLARLFEDPIAAKNEGLRRIASNIETALRGEGISFRPIFEGEPPRSRVRTADVEASIPWGEFDDRLAEAAKSFGFKSDEIQLLDLSARAGQMILLPAENALAVMECYSSVLSAGSFFVQSLDPTTIGYDDLWRIPGGNNPTPLSRAWTAAIDNPSIPRIVLLDGIERTPLNLWFPSFAKACNSSDRPENLLIFVSMGGKVLDSERAVPELGKQVLPLKLTMQEGATSVFLSRLLGEVVPSGWIDFDARPRPARTDLQNILMKCLKDVPPGALAFALKAHAVAMASNIADVDGKIQALARAINDPGKSADQAQMVSDGHNFLRTLSN